MEKDYGKEFEDGKFWKKIKKFAKEIPFAKQALEMYYCFVDSNTPLWVKSSIIIPLGYFISPIDAIPDFLPIVGWTDDAGVIAGVYTLIKSYVTEEHTRKAEEFLKSL